MFKLLRYFSITSATAIIILTAVLAFFYREYSISHLTRIIEGQNVGLAQSFANALWPKYGKYVESVSDMDGDAIRALRETREIHATLKKLTHNLPILKVKIYNLEGLTVYSSELSQIGASKKGDAGFESTIRLNVPSTKSSFRKTFPSFEGPVTNRNLIESYLPVHEPDGQVEGVFELYTDVTPLMDEIDQTTTVVVTYLLLGLGLLYVVLFFIVRRADHIISDQHNNLRHEISERHSAELKYKKAKEEADTANLAKSEFLATMSHEIRTPMTGVLGMTDLTLDTKLTAKQRRYIETVKDSGKALMTILNDILDFSKLEAGKLSIENIDFHLPSLLEEIISLLGQRASEKGIDLTYEIDGDVPEGINSDPGRVRQMLFNFVGNAIKFTDVGKVEIFVSRILEDEDQFLLTFTVKDSGIGVPEEAQGRLFGKFEQADASISRTHGGTGLGLAICKMLSELMGGTVGMKGKEGEGSTFYFSIQGKVATTEVYRQPAALRTSDFFAKRKLKLLLAEDNKVNQMFIATLLGTLGHSVDVAANGQIALEMLQENTYDLLLSDIRMPIMDGMVLTASIRELESEVSKIPVIGVTADAMTDHQEQYISAGMNEVASKPIDLQDLLQKMDKVLGETIHIRITHGTPEPETGSIKELDEPSEDTGPGVDDFLKYLQNVADKYDVTE